MSTRDASTSRPVVFGCAGPRLTDDERRLFEAARPLGLILFARNIETPQQVQELVTEFRACIDDGAAPVLIDQEGGRVARLRPPQWREAPPAARFGALANGDLKAAREAVRLNAGLLAAELSALGITVDCAPVLDVPAAGSHEIIGDRAFGSDPEMVATLGRAAMAGFLEAGVLPVVKHIPGHGRATVDSHEALPRVDAGLEALAAHDFKPFAALHDAPWAMTAHVVYTAIDDAAPATLSAKVIGEVIRGAIGFDGVLVSDDLNMAALSGAPAERAQGALAAGCDLALHCSGKIEEMRAVAEAVPAIGDEAAARIERAEARRRSAGGAREERDVPKMAAALERLMAQV